ncbi:DUF2057 family protein [Aliikangiella coralliicola]|uniref:DUF2057 domain-containing protein n=1 Tax=Aliikangiella coralliicola TaxID=2592383 RepID=A0A545UDJ7_9GAMM|nr:DUF2057 family protein [Aliikangiella coralliicola]TQV87529.1 DUF2057 domain-containing protein [Aliikangiella coralliicola]
MFNQRANLNYQFLKFPFSSLLIKALLILSVFLFSSVQAQPKLTIAESFNIKALNGKNYPSGLLNQNRQLSLRPGLNKLAIEFEEVYEDEDGENFDIVKSDPYLLSIYLEKDGNYFQRFIKPVDASAAKRYILNPVFEVVKGDRNSKVKFQLRPLASDQTSFLISETRPRQKAAVNLSHQNKNSGSISPNNKASILSGENSPQRPISQGRSMPTKMLHYWWQQASPEERKAFLQSIEKGQ